MNAESLREMLGHRPFRPLAIHMSSGEIHEVRHPEFAMVLKTNVLVGYPDTDRFALLALLHISSVETLQAA